MANTVRNNGIAPQGPAAAGAAGGARPNGEAGPAANAGGGPRDADAMRAVNDNLTKNPNHAAPRQTARDAPDAGEPANPANRYVADAPPAAGEPAKAPDPGEPAARANAGRGHGARTLPPVADAKGNPGGGGRPINPLPIDPQNGRGINPLPIEPQAGARININPLPPIGVTVDWNRDGRGHGGEGGGGGGHDRDDGWRPTLGAELRVRDILGRGNGRAVGVVRQVVGQILRQNDIYLSRAELNRIVGNQHSSPAVRALLENVTSRVVGQLPRAQDKLVHEIARETARQIRESVEAARDSLRRDGALTFGRLNSAERMHAAASMMPEHIPAKALDAFLSHRSPEVVSGMLLARGLVASRENPPDVRVLMELKNQALPSGMPMTAVRDVGRLVQGLIADSAAARTTSNLEVAVQKFVRLLIANNELGVLLATIDLAAEASNGATAIGRSLALAKIYELIGRLVAAGEKSLAGEKAASGGRNIFLQDDADGIGRGSRSQATETAAALRQFLDFNPHHRFDRAASAFFDPNDARAAQRDFASAHDAEIDAWLRSGNHRLVKDVDLDRPVGVVVERGGAAFEASVARFVLVRDGSVQGWHFLKTLLIAP